MKDRQPQHPNRVLVTPEDGSTPFYATITRADDPIEPGHRLNKDTLLKDATCTMLGGDPATMTPDDALQMLAALACSGGGSGDAGELEDYSFEVGEFTNAAAGWCSYKFREAFDAPPKVVAQALNFSGIVQIRNVTATGFQYCLRQAGVADGSVSKATLYTGSSTGTNPSHSAVSVVTGVTLPSVGMNTTASAIVVHYIAIEYGGER